MAQGDGIAEVGGTNQLAKEEAVIGTRPVLQDRKPIQSSFYQIVFIVMHIQLLRVFVVAVKITEEVDGQPDVFYPITCGDAKATLIWKKFVCPGINVKCVQVCAAPRTLASFHTLHTALLSVSACYFVTHMLQPGDKLETTGMTQ